MTVLKDSSNFLIEVVDEPVAAKIKEQVLFIDGRSVQFSHVTKEVKELLL